MPWRMRLRSAVESVTPRAPATMSSDARPILAKSKYGPANVATSDKRRTFANQSAVFLSFGEAASDADRVRTARECGAEKHPPAGHGFARSRSNCRSVTVHLSGTDCGVKHTLSSHAW